MKKIFLLVLSVFSILLVLSFTSCGEEDIEIGDTVADESLGLKFSMAEDGCYTASANKLNEKKKIDIPTSYNGIPVKKIDLAGFADYTTLEEITIPESIINIGTAAFKGCTSLKKIIIPDSVESIGSNAFEGCLSMFDLILGKSLVTIGNEAFKGCYGLSEIRNLSKINIKEGKTNNGYAGFYALKVFTDTETATNRRTDESGFSFYDDGKKLFLIGYKGEQTEITLPFFEDRSYTIHKYAMGGNRTVTKITFSDSVTKIGEYAFYNNEKLEKISLSPSIKEIGASAFSSCPSLLEVTIPYGVKKLEEKVFYRSTALHTVRIGEDVASIGASTFAFCTGLKKVEFCSTGKLSTLGDYLFQECHGLETISLPKSIEYIGSYAFFDLDSLKSVTLYKVQRIGSYAFYDCKNLTDIFYYNTLEDWNKTPEGTASFQKHLTIHYDFDNNNK